jgi:phosphoheptose isomerase
LNEELPEGVAIAEPAQWRWIPGALEGLARLHKAGVRLSVATNQAGVGRGAFSAEQLTAVHARMVSDAAQGGAVIAGVFVCCHAPDANCNCRKPMPALITQALSAANTMPEETLVVGDDLRDLEAAWSAGVSPVLVKTGKGRGTHAGFVEGTVACFDDLSELADAIIGDSIRIEQPAQISAQGIFAEHARVVRLGAATLPPVLAEVINRMSVCLTNGHKVLACGNGGSASDAQHLVAELVGRFRNDRPALAAVALTGDAATMTAVANDFGFAHVFARQIQALAKPGDLLVAISTSGNSANILAAAKAARAQGCIVVGMTGAGGGQLAVLCDMLLAAPSSVTARIQELHALCIHVIAQALDNQLGR